MINGIQAHNILFLDIETVPQVSSYDQLSDDWQHLWQLKSAALLKNREDETTESIYERAGIYAEFGKIICISCGILSGEKNNRTITIKSFSGADESVLLKEFSAMLQKWSSAETRYLCGHNAKEFDFPYICRRLIINKLPIPNILQIAGKKPWEVTHLDTMELWKFGDFKNYTSLHLLAHALGVPTPKDDIDGSMVAKVYYEEKNLDRIVIYCQKDVVTTAQIFLRLTGESLISPENINIKV